MKRLTPFLAGSPAGITDRVRAWISLRQGGKVQSAAVATKDKDRARVKKKRERIQNEISLIDPTGRTPCAQDVASEAALSRLYNRWISYHKSGRELQVEEQGRFYTFMEIANSVYKVNQKRGLSDKLELNEFAYLGTLELKKAMLMLGGYKPPFRGMSRVE